MSRMEAIKVKPEIFPFLSSSVDHVEKFRSLVWHFYSHHKRSFLWRELRSPYHIVVSEVMLQQTTTERVAQKFPRFIEVFPDFLALANAPFSQVLSLWKGLGYNRRAFNLQMIASTIEKFHEGQLPESIDQLKQFKGIGKATACSIFTFAFNRPSVFIETNIRSAFLYFYFKGQENHSIHDDELLKLVEMTLDNERPREWYYALMDIGAFIKKTVGNQNYKSRHYKKQSSFNGSNRQLRGRILQSLLNNPNLFRKELEKMYEKEAHRLNFILDDLIAEGIVKQKDQLLYL